MKFFPIFSFCIPLAVYSGASFKKKNTTIQSSKKLNFLKLFFLENFQDLTIFYKINSFSNSHLFSNCQIEDWLRENMYKTISNHSYVITTVTTYCIRYHIISELQPSTFFIPLHIPAYKSKSLRNSISEAETQL